MCYSALVMQNFKDLQRLFQVQIDELSFESIFQKRLDDAALYKATKSLEHNFLDNPQSRTAKECRRLILDFREKEQLKFREQIEKSKDRLADAERRFSKTRSKSAKADIERAGRQIEKFQSKIKWLMRDKPSESDDRVFANYFVPLIVPRGKDELVVSAYRYKFLPPDKDLKWDRTSDLFNAKIESLNPSYFERIRRDAGRPSIWENVLYKKHGVLVYRSFREWVCLHDYEGRALRKGEKEKMIQVDFIPDTGQVMFGPCLFDTWKKGENSISSLALLTTEPTPEVATRGQDRIPCDIRQERLGEWFWPPNTDYDYLMELVHDRNLPYFNSEAAA